MRRASAIFILIIAEETALKIVLVEKQISVPPVRNKRRHYQICHPERVKRVAGSSHYLVFFADIRCVDPSTPFGRSG